MNWAALIPLAVKYGPLIFSFIQTQGPGIQAFIVEIEGAIAAAKNADGTINWAALLPVALKYAPQLLTFANQTHGIPIQTIISDIAGAFAGKSVTTTAVPSPVLSGPAFVFPPQVPA